MNSIQVNRVFMKLANIYVFEVDDLKRILKKVRIEGNRGCWFYNEDWSQYATYKKQGLHRLIYKAFVGKIKGKNVICHKCDRKGCINPDHLYQGTESDNQQDFRLKKKLRKLRKYIIVKKEADEKAHEHWNRSR